MKTDEIEKLLPCPFCGGRSEITEDVRLGFTTVHGLHMVQCSECARSDGHVYKTKKAARNSWNTRTPDLAAEVVRLRAERDDWRSRAEFAEAQVEAVQDILPPEAGLLKKRLAEKRGVLEGGKEPSPTG